MRHLRLRDRIAVIWRFLVVDWRVLHAHTSREITIIALALGERRAKANEVVLEAGCWQGGSSIKFSILCRLLGYRLRIYDSFEGVEVMSEEEKSKSFDFSGFYAAPETLVLQNIARYGEPSVCTTHRGWFSDTLAGRPVSQPVRLAYIDCDLAKGTKEALSGVVPALVPDGIVFSQDCHLPPVFEALSDPNTWAALNAGSPQLERFSARLLSVRFDPNTLNSRKRDS